jgi:hypothetical protein
MQASFWKRETGIVYIHNCSQEEVELWAWKTGNIIHVLDGFSCLTFTINNIEIKLFT